MDACLLYAAYIILIYSCLYLEQMLLLDNNNNNNNNNNKFL